ncbi:energy transducer TonB [Tenacibaculum finnmarkense genomovar finnmarkense]|uniref:energy transducer TonB family protein n=1 Tax=Tenacibaculum finnmarkense TaxID=2781243 RepID=UPI001E334C80|nr:energy transducer TonB [Tenacibaculum finnmarkense]MCD8417444.1 energy transducer TonB [Tenacibaculum finnmarkense genomovar finnmarkense]MCG8185827.1 energy transducer TonB [Tenacibaculum finnmarkense genomovar finnmarkense]MCG8202379.1 energy transducer TonB [Tenacibaculum finnmarkense genomovar finnmarkense]MCG8209869.1 energy transducer TonB [Tenacibaculum finnmarkense genomovar finnmarkense]MCG8212580.1 energy transducer TonB [Tenacibaculum finnmarkense genomovar finnmarkense]
MKILETAHQRKAAVITAVILMLLLFGVFNFGIKYLDPPIEYGVAINLGSSDVGSGEPVEEMELAAASQAVSEENESQDFDQNTEDQPKEEVEEEITEQTQPLNESSQEIQEDIITDDTAKDAPSIAKSTKEKEVVKDTSEEKIKEKVKEKPKKTPKKKPKPSKQTTDALNSLLNGTANTGAKTGEGDDAESGIKGNKNGDSKASKYYGNSKSGTGGNYNLAGRKALSKPIKKPDCQEEGTIVVSIEVNKNGIVTKAQTGGLKGSTSSAPCLEKAAKQAALKTIWNAANDAPQKQRGTIIYKFSLSE